MNTDKHRYKSGILGVILAVIWVECGGAGVETVTGQVGELGMTLSREHVLVDFEGADQVSPDRYEADAVVVRLEATDRPSVATDDSVVTDEDTSVSVSVLENDFDPDQDDLFVVTAVNGEASHVGVQFQLPSGALLRVESDGDYEYDPNGVFDNLPLGFKTLHAP